MLTKMVLSLVDTLIFANPEALILNEKWRKMLQTPVYQENLFGIVADESQVIPKWYVDIFHLSSLLYYLSCLHEPVHVITVRDARCD